MLLLVVQSELDQRIHRRLDAPLDQAEHALVDVGTICTHLLERGP